MIVLTKQLTVTYHVVILPTALHGRFQFQVVFFNDEFFHSVVNGKDTDYILINMCILNSNVDYLIAIEKTKYILFPVRSDI